VRRGLPSAWNKPCAGSHPPHRARPARGLRAPILAPPQQAALLRGAEQHRAKGQGGGPLPAGPGSRGTWGRCRALLSPSPALPRRRHTAERALGTSTEPRHGSGQQGRARGAGKSHPPRASPQTVFIDLPARRAISVTSAQEFAPPIILQANLSG